MKRSDSVLDKSLYTHKKNPKKQHDNAKLHQKTSITQRLWNDLGRSSGVTTVIQLVWLNRFTGFQSSHLPQIHKYSELRPGDRETYMHLDKHKAYGTQTCILYFDNQHISTLR